MNNQGNISSVMSHLTSMNESSCWWWCTIVYEMSQDVRKSVDRIAVGRRDGSEERKDNY